MNEEKDKRITFLLAHSRHTYLSGTDASEKDNLTLHTIDGIGKCYKRNMISFCFRWNQTVTDFTRET